MDNQSAFERAMGMSGYRGSPAELEDRREGIKVGGQAYWKVEPTPILGDIIAMEIDAEGDPWFTLTFPNDDHKDVKVERGELIMKSMIRHWTAESGLRFNTKTLIGISRTMLHDGLAHGRSQDWIDRYWPVIANGLEAGTIYNARYKDANHALNSAYSTELNGILNRFVPGFENPQRPTCLEIYHSLPFELRKIEKTMPLLLEMEQRYGAESDPVSATLSAVRMMVERWTPVAQALDQVKPFVVKGRAPAAEPRKTPERSIDNTGTCSCCARNIKLDDDKIVDHGFQIAGGGREGKCFGVGYPPIEIDPEGLVAFTEHLENQIARNQETIAKMDLDDLDAVIDTSNFRMVKIMRSEPGFDRVRRRIITQCESAIMQLKQQRDRNINTLATWEPQPLPDGRDDHLERAKPSNTP